MTAQGVVDLDRVHVQPIEGLPHLWDIVDTDDHLSFYRSGQLGHFCVLLQPKVRAVAFRSPIRRVAIKQGVLTVVLGDTALPTEVLDVGLGEA